MQQKKRWLARDARTPTVARPTLTEPYGAWIAGQSWDWWATFTFAVWIHPDTAAQKYNRWAVDLQAETGTVMRHARALEYQRRGVVHFHALIWGVKRRTSRKGWQEKWEEIAEGWCAIYPYDRTRHASFYLGKYAVKGGEVDHLTFGESSFRPDDVRIRRAHQSPPTARGRDPL